MKVLWLGNIVLPRIAEQEQIEKAVGVSWLIGLSERVGKREDIELCYVFDAPKRITGHTDFYSYYGISINADKDLKSYIRESEEILKTEKPDIIHIWGTEKPHTYAMVCAAENLGVSNKVVISIQGLVSVYSSHYLAHLPHKVANGISIKDIIKGNAYRAQRAFAKTGELEIAALKKVKHIIGRTDWDKACAWSINSEAEYHFNNETLRDEFYTGKWDYAECEKHSIFFSQANYPIKGLHLMVEALATVKRFYPNVHLYVGGKDYFKIPAWKKSTYEKYVLRLIKENGLGNNISFTGFLSAEQMKENYLNSNVFVSASSIENSPNSVGEAMILGVPVIASRVGGVHNLLNHGAEGLLYPADEPYQLAHYIHKIFSDPNTAKCFGENARKHAMMIHDGEKNVNELIKIYQKIDNSNVAL